MQIAFERRFLFSSSVIYSLLLFYSVRRSSLVFFSIHWMLLFPFVTQLKCVRCAVKRALRSATKHKYTQNKTNGMMNRCQYIRNIFAYPIKMSLEFRTYCWKLRFFLITFSLWSTLKLNFSIRFFSFSLKLFLYAFNLAIKRQEIFANCSQLAKCKLIWAWNGSNDNPENYRIYLHLEIKWKLFGFNSLCVRELNCMENFDLHAVFRQPI